MNGTNFPLKGRAEWAVSPLFSEWLFYAQRYVFEDLSSGKENRAFSNSPHIWNKRFMFLADFSLQEKWARHNWSRLDTSASHHYEGQLREMCVDCRERTSLGREVGDEGRTYKSLCISRTVCCWQEAVPLTHALQLLVIIAVQHYPQNQKQLEYSRRRLLHSCPGWRLLWSSMVGIWDAEFYKLFVWYRKALTFMWNLQYLKWDIYIPLFYDEIILKEDYSRNINDNNI